MRCDGRGGAKAKPDAFSQPVDPSGGALDEPLDIFRVGGSMFLFKAFRSRVTFSLAPKCVEVNCWIQAFLTCEVMAMLGHLGGQILSPPSSRLESAGTGGPGDDLGASEVMAIWAIWGGQSVPPF